MASIQEKFEKKNITARRKLFDNNIRIVGIEAEVVRLKVTEDKYEDETITIINQDKITIRISYPGELPIDRYRADAIPEPQVEESHAFFFEVLPIEIFTKWTDNVEKGDLLLHKFQDENGNPIKILMKASESLGTFQTLLLWKKMYAAPYNGILPEEVRTIISEL